MDKLKESVNTFNKYADQYQDKYMGYAPYVESYRRLASLLDARWDVLDAACGPGNISKFLLDQEPSLSIHGIDLAPKMIELARANCPSAIFEVMDSREIESLVKRYDAIVAGFLFPYFSKSEVERFILAARTLIKHDGIFYISTMEGDYQDSAYQSNGSEDRVYTYYHEPNYLRELLEGNGFRVELVERKVFPEVDGKETIDLFIYARRCTE